MIADKFVDLYARNSGLRNKLVAERDVVLTYALRALVDAGVMDHLAIKSGAKTSAPLSLGSHIRRRQKSRDHRPCAGSSRGARVRYCVLQTPQQ